MSATWRAKRRRGATGFEHQPPLTAAGARGARARAAGRHGHARACSQPTRPGRRAHQPVGHAAQLWQHVAYWHMALSSHWAVMATRTRTRAVGQLWAPTELREPMSRFGREIRASSGRACVNKPGQAKFVWAPHSRRVNAAHDTHRCDVRVGPWAACGSVQPRHGRLRCATKRLIKAIPAAAASSARPSSP